MENGMKTKITALLAAALLLPPAAFAAEVGISEDAISVDFDGSAGGELAVYILDKNGEPVYADMKAFDGGYDFNCLVDSDIEAGEYTYIIRSKTDTADSGKITLTNRSAYKAFMQLAASASSAGEIRAALAEFDPALNAVYYDAIDKGIFSGYIFAEAKSAAGDVAKFNLILKRLAALTALRQNTDGIIADGRLSCMALVGADEGTLALYDLLAAAGVSNVNSGTVSKPYADCAEAADTFKKLVYTNYITNSDITIDEAKNFFVENAAYLGIDAKNVTNDTVRALIKSKAATPEALKKAYESTQSTGSESGSGSTGGSSGGGSSSGGGGGSYIPVSTGTGSSSAEPFGDIASCEWAKPAIFALAREGIVSGKADGVFAPQDQLRREEFVAMMVRLFGYEGDGQTEFSDVEPTGWYAGAVSAAVQNEIIFGTSADRFGVGERISRQDVAVIAFRALRSDSTVLDSDIDGVELADIDAIADYAKTAVKVLKKNGIVNGYPDGSFAPSAGVTRAEAAQIMYNIMNFRNAK